MSRMRGVLVQVQKLLVSSIPPHASRALPAPPLVLWMAMSIAAVTALAYWDEERESRAALEDFAREQETLAHGVAAALSVSHPPSGVGAPLDPAGALASLAALDRRPGLRLFLVTPAQRGMLATDGHLVQSPVIEAAVSAGHSIARLSREEASELGLRPRSAVAGIWSLQGDGAQGFRAVAVATAGGERDRELRAKWRLLLSVVLAAGLVFLFGGSALRRQRRQLELARELSLQALARERDERLVRADKLATLGALAMGIAHEVSTPLGVIIGRAEQVLPRVADEPRSARAVQAILDQAKRINEVVRGILSLARGLAPTLEHVEPALVARAACELVQHRFAKAGVDLSLTLDPDLPHIACEPRLFEQVLVNLLLNACDACRAGGHVALQVRAREGRVAFIVLDDGSGISPGAAARATEPFFTTKPHDQGTGLGLAIANEIVKHHHGTLTLGPRSDAACGTCAGVELAGVRD